MKLMGLSSCLASFKEVGFVRLPRAADPVLIQGVCRSLWCALESEFNIRRDERETWSVPNPSPKLQLTIDCGPASSGLLKVLFDQAPWGLRREWTRCLVTFPTSDHWTLPKTGWHLDAPVLHTDRDRLNRVRIFTFLDRVVRFGGGTLVVAGSHLIVAKYAQELDCGEGLSSSQIKRRFRKDEAWFRDLSAPRNSSCPNEELMQESTSSNGGDGLRVVELTGEEGDVIIMHPWVFHASAPNVTSEPRFMLAQLAERQKGCEFE